MSLIMTTIAALIFTTVWAVKKQKSKISSKSLITASLMFWSAAIMWSIDGIANIIDKKPFFDISLSDSLLGLIIVAAGVLLFLLFYFYEQRQKGSKNNKKGLSTIAIVLTILLISTASIACKKSSSTPKQVANNTTNIEQTLPHQTTNSDAPVVYFIKDITPESLVKVFEATKWEAKGKVGVKISTGEPPASNYLRPELIKELVQKLNGTIVESNTAYGGKRASVAMHKEVAKEHGFTQIAPFDLQDEEGSMEISVRNPKNIKVNYVGTHFKNYDSYLVLSHFKGHAMAGFGGAIKNLSIGFSSGAHTNISGKVYIHSAGKRVKGSIMGDQTGFLESMAEAAQAVCDYMDNGKNIVFVNVLNRLSVDCDCDGNAAEPDMHDIGILASTDPLAIDQAAIDLVYAAPDSKSLQARIESRNGLHTLDYAQEIQLGSRYYQLVRM